MKEKNKKNIKLIIALLLVLLLIVGGITTFLFMKHNPSSEEQQEETVVEEKIEEPIIEEKKKVQIFDMDAHTRPIAVVINNTPVAVKVQEGINNSYILYEFPTEGNTSRLMALYQNTPDVNIGTIRSARHNFIDYANENDAIFVAYGWSVFAKKELQAGAVDYINGITGAGPFWRDNKENLAYEHTVYTNLAKIKEFVSSSYRMTSDVLPPLNYSAEEIILDGDNAATSVLLNYGPSNVEHYVYNEDTKMYMRNFNDVVALDHETKEQVSVRNIIVVKIAYGQKENSKYLDFYHTGTGNGYFITNGKMETITWKKDSRNGRTKYLNSYGEEITVNDGRTLIALIGDGREIRIG